MIFKSYIIEQNIQMVFDKKLFLIYGENQGLKNDIKNLIIQNKKNSAVLRLYQDEILKNENLFYNEINNKSLFEENKIIFINEASDKIFTLIEKIASIVTNEKVFIFQIF